LTPSIFQVLFKTDDPALTKFTYDAQLNIRSLLLKLPKRSIHQYRCLDLNALVSDIYNSKITIVQEDLLALDTINKSIKRLKSLLLFARNSGMYNGIIPNMTIENRMQPRGQRKEFTNDELQIIDHVLQGETIYPIIKILQYSGMRFSELLKCSVSEIEGVLCFDLRTPTEPLKTLSSHRVIPVHPNLNDSINGFQELIRRYFDKHFAKKFTKVIKKHLQDTQGKSLYSLRHSFATQLIANGTPAEIVSELMGHSHSSMTLNRYVKGYPITVLKAAINSL
jgi:integrase